MRILVASYEPRLVTHLCRALSQDHHTVDLVADNVVAFDLAYEAAYDIIILNLRLPPQEGLALCHRMRSVGIVASVLVVIQAHGMVEDRVAVLNAGADDVMSEPFAPEELLARVNALMRRYSWDHTSAHQKRA